MNTNRSFSRLLALVLTVALMLAGIPLAVSAEAAGCTHEHDEACGYVAGASCGHGHDEVCGWDEDTETGCTHDHDDDCGYIEAVPCGHAHDASCGGLPDLDAPLTVTVASFDELDEYTLWQGYDYGAVTGEGELDLPQTLSGRDADGESLAIAGVTWQSDSEFDAAFSAWYYFSPVLPEGYILEEDASAPVISVFIRPEGGMQIMPLANADSLISTIGTYGLM